jgi:hypothetical protein
VTTPPTSADEPTSAALVASQLSKDPEDFEVLEQLEPTVAAVNRFVRRLHNPGPDGTWAPDHQAGALLLAARLYRRRNSPDGVYTLGGEQGVAYVARTDPDVAMYLQLGAYAVPTVG